MAKKSLDEFKEELKRRFPDNNVEILEYSGAAQPITYKCLDCGLIYKKSRANHLYENKTLCQKCVTTRESKIRNKFIYLLDKDNFIAKTTIGATTEKVLIECKKCGAVREINQDDAIHTGKINCFRCGTHGKKSVEDFKYRMGEKAKDYKILEYKNYTTKVLFKHTCGFEFSQLPGNFLRGRGCPKCYGKISKGEQKILKWLNDNQIAYEFQKKFEDLPLKSFDFYIPEKNILIEYQGEQHYKPLNCFGGEEKFNDQTRRDNEKRQYCKEKGYNLIEIPYYEKDFEKFLLPLKGSTTINVDSSELKENY